MHFVVNAISNYTLRVRDENLSDDQREEALKFLGTRRHLPFPCSLLNDIRRSRRSPLQISGSLT